MAKVAILCVPFIRYDFHTIFAMQTMISINSQQTSHEIDRIAIVNSARQEPNDLNWIRESFNFVSINDRNCLSRAWNKGIDIAFLRDADYVLAINLDVVLHPKCVENLVECFLQNPDVLVCSASVWENQESLLDAPLDNLITSSAHFSCFMFDKRLIEKVGYFDEAFQPAYHEDSDMIYRLQLGKYKFITTSSAKFYHLDRVTLKGAMINDDQEFLLSTRKAMDDCMEYYTKKWGGLPTKEIFKTPFNNPK